MISTTLRAVMIYQVCDLDKKTPRTVFSVFFGDPYGNRNFSALPKRRNSPRGEISPIDPLSRDRFDPTQHADKSKKTLDERLFVFGDPYGNRTHVTAVKGPCLNRLTNGPGSGNWT